MRSLGTWFSGGFGSVRLTVGFDDREGLLQRKYFYDSRFLWASTEDERAQKWLSLLKSKL